MNWQLCRGDHFFLDFLFFPVAYINSGLILDSFQFIHSFGWLCLLWAYNSIPVSIHFVWLYFLNLSLFLFYFSTLKWSKKMDPNPEKENFANSLFCFFWYVDEDFCFFFICIWGLLFNFHMYMKTLFFSYVYEDFCLIFKRILYCIVFVDTNLYL